MKVRTFDGKKFELQSECHADQQLLDAIDLFRHITILQPMRSPKLLEGARVWENTGVMLLVAADDPEKLVADSCRKALGGFRELLRLLLAEPALERHVGASPANPDAEKTLATLLKELQVVLQALGAQVKQRELMGEEVMGSHGATSSGTSVGQDGGAA